MWTDKKMEKWGAALPCRRPAKDDGEWKAFVAHDGDLPYSDGSTLIERFSGPNGFNCGRTFWYNATTHEHKWELPSSLEELQEWVDMWSGFTQFADGTLWGGDLHDDVADIAHKYETLIVHSLVHPDRWYGEEPDVEKSTAYSTALADEALLSMRADVAILPPPDEPGVWRSCITSATPLRDMGAYRDMRKPSSILDDPRNPKNGTHVECSYHAQAVQPVWKREERVSGKAKVWRCTVKGWSQANRRRLHELARGWHGWGQSDAKARAYKNVPAVKRGALRVKGFPWSTRAGTAGSVLEGLFVFDNSTRAGTLEREVFFERVVDGRCTLDVTWEPVSFAVWEEEVWHFGLYDVVFEQDARQRESDQVLCWTLMEITLERDMQLRSKGLGTRGGNRGSVEHENISSVELHAAVLMIDTCWLEYALRNLPAEDVERLRDLPPTQAFKSRVVSYRHVCEVAAMLRGQGELDLCCDDGFEQLQKLQMIHDAMGGATLKQQKARLAKQEADMLSDACAELKLEPNTSFDGVLSTLRELRQRVESMAAEEGCSLQAAFQMVTLPPLVGDGGGAGGGDGGGDGGGYGGGDGGGGEGGGEGGGGEAGGSGVAPAPMDTCELIQQAETMAKEEGCPLEVAFERVGLPF